MNNYNKKIGILYILGAAFGFALMGFFVRMAGDLPTFEKAFFRNLIAAFVAFFMLMKSGGSKSVSGKNLGILVLRSACGMAGIICNFYAIDHMNIADATILNKMSPFFAILAGFLILKEKAGAVDIIATVIAFIGMIFVAKPGAGFTFFPALIGIAGGMMAGIAYTLVRKLAGNGVNGMFFNYRRNTVYSYELCKSKPYTACNADTCRMRCHDRTDMHYKGLQLCTCKGNSDI